jgi:Putative lumazine-binding
MFLSAILSCGFSQSVDETAAKKVIQQLFEGMHRGDSSMVHSVFADKISMATLLRDKAGNSIIQRESSLNGFLNAIGTPHEPAWSEEIWNVRINIDDNFAQAWCDYAFYIGDTFSHCGVDAFHLHKTKGGWKIFHLADTRRKEGCEIPKKIRSKHKQ